MPTNRDKAKKTSQARPFSKRKFKSVFIVSITQILTKNKEYVNGYSKSYRGAKGFYRGGGVLCLFCGGLCARQNCQMDNKQVVLK